MTRAYCKGLTSLFLAAVALCVPWAARAAILVDPQALYNRMNDAYRRGTAQGWSFYNREYYLATIFDAGRAYSLQRPNDPNYGQVEQLTVDLASELHYDPLINHEAVNWYVREAAAHVARTAADPSEVQKANDLLARVDAIDDPASLAKLADADAQANLAAYPRDDGAQLQTVEADWRGWMLTHDDSWRNLAFVRAAAYDFPIDKLPSNWGPGFLAAVRTAAAGETAYTQPERDNAQLILANLHKRIPLHTIANVRSQPAQDYVMSTLAPADEYFGPLGMSILGIRNTLKHINYMIGYGYAHQESATALQVAVSIDDLHKVYPRDRAVPQLLFEAMSTLAKIGTPDAKAARAHLRTVLTVEYQDSKEAREILGVSVRTETRLPTTR